MAGRGGARPGSGAKKGQHRIAAGELRTALEARLGTSYVEMLAETQLKLFNDFKNDTNVKEFIRFTENMSNRILENQTHSIDVSGTSELTRDEVQERINNLLARQALATPAQPTTGPVAPLDSADNG